MKRPKIGERRVFMVPDHRYEVLWNSSPNKESVIELDRSHPIDYPNREYFGNYLVPRQDGSYPMHGEIIIAECIDVGTIDRCYNHGKWKEVKDGE